MPVTQRAILFANGEAPAPDRLRVQEGDFFVAVDGGLHHIERLGLSPHLLIGDFDSITPQELERCAQRGVEILRFPPAKDQTDLELALETVLARGFGQIQIAFGLGGRLDHCLGNLALLNRPDLAGRELYFDDGEVEVWLVRESLSLPTQPGELISLLPWQGSAKGVFTEGLAYPLMDETLYAHQARGVSNVCTGTKIRVAVQVGAVLLFHYHKAASEGEDNV